MNFGYNVGYEIDKKRPAIILSVNNDIFDDYITVAPIRSNGGKGPSEEKDEYIKIPNILKEYNSYIDLTQVRTISKMRLSTKKEYINGKKRTVADKLHESLNNEILDQIDKILMRKFLKENVYNKMIIED